MSELAANDPRHGTTNGYMNHGCRCGQCREANRLYYMARRRARGILPRQPKGTNVTHGIASTYHNGCRCDDCRKAASLYRRALRRRQGMQPRSALQKYEVC